MLKYIGDILGITVNQMPKCVPELVDCEGIEYSWTCGKGWYHMQPHGRKSSKDSFHTLVKECLDTGVLSVEKLHSF